MSGHVLAMFRGEFGSIVVTGFERCDRGWVRHETWHGNDGTINYESSHSARRLGERDLTPRLRTYATGYDPRCGWCYLGATHTEAAHAEAVEPAQTVRP